MCNVGVVDVDVAEVDVAEVDAAVVGWDVLQYCYHMCHPILIGGGDRPILLLLLPGAEQTRL